MCLCFLLWVCMFVLSFRVARLQRSDTIRCVKSCQPNDVACVLDPVHSVSHTFISMPTFREFAKPEGRYKAWFKCILIMDFWVNMQICSKSIKRDKIYSSFINKRFVIVIIVSTSWEIKLFLLYIFFQRVRLETTLICLGQLLSLS